MIDLHVSSLQCAHLPFDHCIAGLEPMPGNTLGIVGFSSGFSAAATPVQALNSPVPLALVPMAPLGVNVNASTGSPEAPPVGELWHTSSPVHYGKHGTISYACSDSLLFGSIQLAEASFADTAAAAGKTALQCAAEHAYAEIFSLLGKLSFPEILRFWNYIADINGCNEGHSDGMERYRQFNMGRYDGFRRVGQNVVGSVPAASAVGYPEGPLTIYFLAARDTAPIAIENPRQVSAYQYPSEYGPRSPTFSRASVARIGDDHVLFLSGTASIVGHETKHAHDVAAQTRETMTNISAVIDEANRIVPDAGFKLEELCYKVYVRHEKDTGTICQELRSMLGQNARLIFLRADICRHDLLLEIEATAGHPLQFLMPSSH